jgi:hypothetical protein
MISLALSSESIFISWKSSAVPQELCLLKLPDYPQSLKSLRFNHNARFRYRNQRSEGA